MYLLLMLRRRSGPQGAKSSLHDLERFEQLPLRSAPARSRRSNSPSTTCAGEGGRCLRGAHAGCRDRAGSLGRRGGRGRRGPAPSASCPVKDLNFMVGANARMGSAVFDLTSYEDDYVVKAMRDAGLVFTGKTTTPEFGLPCYTRTRTGGECTGTLCLGSPPHRGRIIRRCGGGCRSRSGPCRARLRRWWVDQDPGLGERSGGDC